MRLSSKGIPEITLRRYAKYLAFVKAMRAEGWDFVTSADISRACNTTEMLVRKDFSYISACGRPHVGYAVESLIADFSAAVGWSRPRRIVFVGSRSLAQMILRAYPLAPHNLLVSEVIDPRNAGGIENFAAAQKSDPVRLAILATDVAQAQSYCDRLVAAGVTAIWNFTPVSLTVGKGVCVVDADLAADLAVLCRSQVEGGEGAAP